MKGFHSFFFTFPFHCYSHHIFSSWLFHPITNTIDPKCKTLAAFSCTVLPLFTTNRSLPSIYMPYCGPYRQNILRSKGFTLKNVTEKEVTFGFLQNTCFLSPKIFCVYSAYVYMQTSKLTQR